MTLKEREATLYSEEMLGKRKPGETLPNLIKSIPTFLRSNYGILSIQFGEPVSFNQYQKDHMQRMEGDNIMAFNLQSKAEYVKTLTSKLAYHLLSKITQAAVAMPTHLCAAIILNFRNGIKAAALKRVTVA